MFWKGCIQGTPKLNSSSDFSPLYDLLARVTTNDSHLVHFEFIPTEQGKDVFEVSVSDHRILLKASSVSALAYAYQYTLFHVGHIEIPKHTRISVDYALLLDKVKNVRRTTPFRYCYYLNYCTLNYTMSFWDWEEWQSELDWAALHGINLMLAPVGHESVWQNTLRKYNFSEEEILQFIPGTAYTAWWLMGNLEGFGGPVSQHWIDQRVDLQEKILYRMRELGIEPILHGFYGMVPSAMISKYLQVNVKEGGKWCHDEGKGGFQRPATLVPLSTEFKSMANVYYQELENYYGKVKLFGGDPFHEGGNTEGISISQSGKAIQEAMLASNPEALWVLQGWEGKLKTVIY